MLEVPTGVHFSRETPRIQGTEHPALGPSPTPLKVSGLFWTFPKDSPLLQALCCRVPGSTSNSLVLQKAMISHPETPLPELLTLFSSLNGSPLATPRGNQTPFPAGIFKDSQEHPLQFPELQILPREFQFPPFTFRNPKPQRAFGPPCPPCKGFQAPSPAQGFRGYQDQSPVFVRFKA